MKLLVLQAFLTLAALAFACVWASEPFHRSDLRRVPAGRVLSFADGGDIWEFPAADGQRRLPIPLAQVSPHLVNAVLAAEDERFRTHSGVDGLAVGRAVLQNFTPGKVRSGASTLSMQVARLTDPTISHGGWGKVRQAVRAWKMESSCAKDDILEAWMNLAPFGGNRCGVEAAAKAYFGRHARDLSLAEAALLAGLPQSPERYRPDLRPASALARRATVLRRMAEAGFITAQERALADAEPLVLATKEDADPALRRLALAMRPTTFKREAQLALTELCRRHAATLPPNLRVEAAVVEVSSGDLIACAGAGQEDAQTVALLKPRSPGSALKPFFYAAAFDAGWLMPASRLPDAAEPIGGWEVRNFDRTTSGEVSAGEALARSLNGPAVRVVRGLGAPRAQATLASLGLRLPASAARDAGLTLATGGAEVRLLDLAGAWAVVARKGHRNGVALLSPQSAAFISLVLEDARDGAWHCLKTGTSSGRRDAVAAGHNGTYAVVVFVGRVEGGASEVLEGARTAAPLARAVFTHPAFRAGEAPAWVEAHRADMAKPAPPLPARAGGDGAPAILEPLQGSRLVAQEGAADIHPRAAGDHAGDAAVCWFLDGRPLTEAQAAQGLRLPVGRYALTAVVEGKPPATVEFSVTPR